MGPRRTTAANDTLKQQSWPLKSSELNAFKNIAYRDESLRRKRRTGAKGRFQKETRMSNIKLISTISTMDTIMTAPTQTHGANGKGASSYITTRIREERATSYKIGTREASLASLLIKARTSLHQRSYTNEKG